jgi:hypothetical protein
MNIVRHSIGDKVVALTNPLNNLCQNRVKGTVYTVLDYTYCSKCGIQSINIGVFTTLEKSECSCGNISLSKGKYWTDSFHFANVDNIKEALSESIKTENYELSSLLRDINII